MAWVHAMTCAASDLNLLRALDARMPGLVGGVAGRS